MNLYRLLGATMTVFPKKQDESDDHYGRRIFLTAAKAIETQRLFEQKDHTKIGSDPRWGEILTVYHKLEQELMGEKTHGKYSTGYSGGK